MPTDTMMQEIYGKQPQSDIDGLKALKEFNAISRNLLNKITPKASKRITIRKGSAVGFTTMQANSDIQAMPTKDAQIATRPYMRQQIETMQGKGI